MKLLILALCIASAAAIIGNRCGPNDDCDNGECCVLKGVTGKCQKLIEEGKKCLPSSFKYEDMYLLKCPCKRGLECKGEKEINIFGMVIHLKPTCKEGGDDNKKDDNEGGDNGGDGNEGGDNEGVDNGGGENGGGDNEIPPDAE